MELIYVLIGVLIGLVIAKIIQLRICSYGYLEINYSNPEKDMYKIMLDDDLDTLATRKRIELKVHISQK